MIFCMEYRVTQKMINLFVLIEMDITKIQLEIYPKNHVTVCSIPFETLLLRFNTLDNCAALKGFLNSEQLGSVLGVYRKKIPDELQDMTHAYIYITIEDAKIKPIEVALSIKRNKPGRKYELLDRLQRICEAIRPYRNRVYDARLLINEHTAYENGHAVRSVEMRSVRDLFYGIYPERTKIEYKNEKMQTVGQNAFSEACVFVARIHRRHALLGAIQAFEKGSEGAPYKMFERHVLRIVKEFL